MGTAVLPSSSHGFENECREIHECWGRTNRLIRALANRTRVERKQIRETYKTMYGEDLASFLFRRSNSINSGQSLAKASAALLMWMLDSCERDAVVAREALKQDDIDFKALVEIFVGRKSSHIALMKQAYQARFKSQLEQDIINIDPPHSFQKILVAFGASHKAHEMDVSQHVAKCDARRLYEVGEGSAGGIEEAVVLEIFSKRSIPQLKLTFSCYKHIYGYDYIKSFKRENSTEFENTLKLVIKCMCNPLSYYAKELHGGIKGRGERGSSLTRVMVSRAEVDMNEIQKVFKKKYGVELRDSICESLPSGDYTDFLLALASKTLCS
ncbi:annexin D8-like [Carica papaya]|uniref:annexin D8-like n=1 Tax=Carica papaya TaxID=3649 RepID=UPI000B8D198F|nr:annexin D8-like [Carica papaya]